MLVRNVTKKDPSLEARICKIRFEIDLQNLWGRIVAPLTALFSPALCPDQTRQTTER